MVGVEDKVRSFLPLSLCIVGKKDIGGVNWYSLLSAEVMLFLAIS